MALIYDKDEYQLSNDNELNELLADLQFELIKESIFDQIDYPIGNHVDYLEGVVDRISIIKKQFPGDEDDVDFVVNEFFKSILVRINDVYNLEMDIHSIEFSENIIEITICIYEYFILNYKNNITNFLVSYIEENRKMLIKEFSDSNKKDVSTITLKKQIKDKDDMTIASNLPSIFNFIISLNIDPIDFLRLSTSDYDYNSSEIIRLIESGLMMGGFVFYYLTLCGNEYIVDECQNDIKVMLHNK